MKAFAAVNIGNAFLPGNSVFRGEGGTIGNLVSKFLPLLYLTAGILTVLYFLFGAVQYIYSGGDPKAKESAQKKIQYAVLGFALVALSFLIVQFLSRLTTLSPTRRFTSKTITCSNPALPLTKKITCSDPEEPTCSLPGCAGGDQNPNCWGCYIP